MTSIKVLSHACLLVKTQQSSIIIDPWLLGSSYWRSWWNYPKADFDAEELSAVDAVFISHIHWDHWHGPTLRKFFKGKLIVIGDDSNTRSFDDLRQIGFQNITIVRHGKFIDIGDIRVYFYNFGLLLNDSALVVRTPDIKLLNANDAKLAGASLDYITDVHGQFDFALRSHSSANSRICYTVPGDGSVVVDDREHYFRSFKLFMDAVRPKYAIPFASNHCHLHEEVFDLNTYVSKPNELAGYLAGDQGSRPWELVTMLPGSSWSSKEGFKLANQDAFEFYEQKLLAYRNEVADRLDHYEQKELRVEISDDTLLKFRGMASKCWVRGLTKVRILLTRPSGPYKSLVFDGGSINENSDLSLEPELGRPLIIIPAIIFRDSIVKNMFHHAGISKRCRYKAVSQRELILLQRFLSRLERLELTGDGGVIYWFRLGFRYAARWRDLWVYALAVYYRVFTRRPFYLVEETILNRHSGNR